MLVQVQLNKKQWYEEWLNDEFYFDSLVWLMQHLHLWPLVVPPSPSGRH